MFCWSDILVQHILICCQPITIINGDNNHYLWHMLAVIIVILNKEFFCAEFSIH